MTANRDSDDEKISGRSETDRIESYLTGLTPDKRAALEKLRKQIISAAPGAVERISYGMPAFDLYGPLVGYAAAKTHCSFFPMNGTTVAAFAKELTEFDTAKGTIRFDPKKPLPATLVKKIVNARVAENKAKMSPATGGKAASAKKAPAKPGRDGVDAFMASLKHPLKGGISEVRAIILGADRSISEGVKWNSVSFKTADYFATVNLRSLDKVQLVFHRGAKAKDGEREMKVPDPKGLIKWLSADRCLVTLGKGAEIAANCKAFEALVKVWIAQI